MADFSVGVGDAAAVKLFSHRLFTQAIQSTTAWKLASISTSRESPDNIVQILDETQKTEGDNIKYDLIGKLDGDGVIGDNTLAGNEETLTIFQDSIIIDQLRHAVLPRGAMSQQRVPFSMRDQSKLKLVDWWAERWDLSLINQITGNTNQADIRYTGLQATVAPSTTHQIFANGAASEAALASTDNFTLDLIDKAVAKAHTLSTPIKPLRLHGMEIFGVLLLHPYQVRALRENYSTGQWGDIQKAALMGSQISGNPIFTGAIGMYGNVVIHEAPRIPYGSNAQVTGGTSLNAVGVTDVARGVFCGSQAACLAFGRAYGWDMKCKWFEELLDGGNQLRITGGSIFGMKKTRFNSSDYATITISSREAA